MGGDPTFATRALRSAAAIAAMLLCAAGPAEWRASPNHDPVSLYRIARPRSPVPAPPEGVRTIDAATIARAGARVLLVDVSPALPGRRNPADGRWTLPGPAQSIPGAVWFPDAGQAPGVADVIAEFAHEVPRLAGGRPVVVFCLADCWMSWNAALRLHRMGLDVSWYGPGRDGWRAAGRALAPVWPHANTRPEQAPR